MDPTSSKKVMKGLVVFTIASSLVPGTMCVKFSGDFREISQATPRGLSPVPSLVFPSFYVCNVQHWVRMGAAIRSHSRT